MNKIPDFTGMLTDLIAAPSVSSNNPKLDQSNMAIIETLAGWLDDLGFTTQIQQLASSPGKANLIATLGCGPGGLVLAGHTDTVPYDQHYWHSDPLKLIEKDNQLVGLGVCDMKGFFPMAIEAAKTVIGQPFKKPLIIIATADEESSMNGARALASSNKIDARYAVIGEPTNLTPVYMHKGVMMESIHVCGQSGHASNPNLGNSALEAMHEMMSALLQFRYSLQQIYQNSHFEVPIPTINLGVIHGGNSPNRICSECELQIDIRLLPGMEADSIQNQLEKQLMPIAHRRQVGLTVTSHFPGLPAFNGDKESAIVKAAEKLTGYTARTTTFATEAPFLQQMGMDTMILGPGDITQAHQPNESLALNKIDPTITILKQLINQFCL